MALIFTDGFDSYAATSDLIKKWGTVTGGWTWSSSAGRTGAGGITCAAGAAAGVLLTPSIAGGVVTGFFQVNFSVKLSAAPSGNINFLEYLNSAGSILSFMRIGTSGNAIMLAASGSPILTGAKNICDNLWHSIELKWNMANSTQACSIVVDGTTDASGTVNQGAGSSISSFQFLQNNSGMAVNGLDDFIVYDDNGNSPKAADFPLGQRLITTVRPNSDSAVQFTKNTGASNNAALSEVNPDGDTTYVEDGSTGDQDLYGFPSIGFVPVTLNGVMENIYVENAYGGSVNHTQVCKNNVTTTNGSSITTPSAYFTKQQFYGLDPNTGAAWTKAGLDTALFGFKVG